MKLGMKIVSLEATPTLVPFNLLLMRTWRPSKILYSLVCVIVLTNDLVEIRI